MASIRQISPPYVYTINGLQVKEIKITQTQASHASGFLRQDQYVNITCPEVLVIRRGDPIPPAQSFDARKTEAYKTIIEQNNILENRLIHMGRDMRKLIDQAKRSGKMSENDILDVVNLYSLKK